MSRTFPLFPSSALCAIVFLLSAGGAIAQNSNASALTLGEALRRAAERNPALLAEVFRERSATALIEQAELRPNPTLDVSLENFAGTGATRGIRRIEGTIQANQTIERGGKREKRIALASHERDAAAKEYAVRRAEVLAAAAAAYIDVLVAQQRVALAAEPLRLARETVEAVETRVKAGAASPAESARARAGLATAQADFARAESALRSSRNALAAVWGGAPGEVAALSGRLRLPESLPDRDALLGRLAAHPRFQLQQSVIESRRAALELEQAQVSADVSLGGGVRFLREGSDAALVAGVSVPLPVRNRNQGNIRAARESLAGAEQGVRAVEVDLQTAFTTAWQDLATAHLTAVSLVSQALPATEDAYRAVKHAYDQGQLPLIDVLDAQRALVAIRREILESEAAYAAALARIDALTDPSFGALSALISQP